MVRVFKIKVWDNPSGEWIVQAGKFTQKALGAIPRAEIIPGEDEEVDGGNVDRNGRYLSATECAGLKSELEDKENQLQALANGAYLDRPFENREAGLRRRIADLKSLIGTR
ncbi:MAG: hypothetical protein ABR929_07685 [Roseiarcus sp.]|jgi:hypothetical protein